MCFYKCGEPQISICVKALLSRTELSFIVILTVLSWINVQEVWKVFRTIQGMCSKVLLCCFLCCCIVFVCAFWFLCGQLMRDSLLENPRQAVWLIDILADWSQLYGWSRHLCIKEKLISTTSLVLVACELGLVFSAVGKLIILFLSLCQPSHQFPGQHILCSVLTKWKCRCTHKHKGAFCPGGWQP